MSYFPKVKDIVIAQANISKIMRYTMLQKNLDMSLNSFWTFVPSKAEFSQK
jgi:hypothetical protein